MSERANEKIMSEQEIFAKPLAEVDPIVAHQGIFHDGNRASYLLLPIVPPGS